MRINQLTVAILNENFTKVDIKAHGEEILEQLFWLIESDQASFIPSEPRFIPKKIILDGITHIDYLRPTPKESLGWQEIIVNTTPGKFFLKGIDRQWFREVHIEITTKEIKDGVQTSNRRGQARA